ncbi:MAG: hypothetical protein GXP33_01205 [Spirochaetes bacterium]|nr:hypothetical protein [Spirochaetota bacterium]
MKGIICYYSGSGNTKLACNYLKNRIKNADFELHNIVRNGIPDFNKYDIVGFAAFTVFWAPPELMYSFIDRIGNQSGKNAFILNTFGAISGRTLKVFGDLIKAAGFNVVSGFSFHTPESYPPMRKKGLPFDKAPKEKELEQFNAFITDLDNIINKLKNGKTIKNRKLKISLFGRIFPAYEHTHAKKDFGIQKVDAELCKECAVCMNGCPYEAVTMNPKPVFNHDICAGCWYCYNHCKSKAIYTDNFNGDYQYPKPKEELLKKLL